MSDVRERMSADFDALGQVRARYAGSEGEREMLHVVQQRLDPRCTPRTEGFVAHVSPAFSVGMHALLLVLGGVLGFWTPSLGALCTALVTVSLLGEGTGRFALLRWPFPSQASYNLVVRPPTAQQVHGTVIVAAPLDAPRWRAMDRRRWPSWRPMRLVFGAAMVVLTLNILRMLGEDWGSRTLEIYVVALLVLASTVVFGAMMHRAGDGQEDASAPVVALELVRRLHDFPVHNLQVMVLFAGCSRAYQGGMKAFLQLHRKTMADPCLVIALEEPGSSPLHAAVSEGSLVVQHHRATGPALVERLGWAGVRLPMVDRGGATNARAALLAGYRALALVGGDDRPSMEDAEHAVDVLETLVRWYGEDLARLPLDREALAELALQSERVRNRNRDEQASDEDAPSGDEHEPDAGEPRATEGDESEAPSEPSA